MSQGQNNYSVKKLYQTVIEDVMTGGQEAFLDEGVDEQVLQELRMLWEAKLAATKAVEPNPSATTENTVSGNNGTTPQQQKQQQQKQQQQQQQNRSNAYNNPPQQQQQQQLPPQQQSPAPAHVLPADCDLF